MKSEYMPSHCVGSESTSVVRCVACLYIAVVAPIGGDYYRVLRRWVLVLNGHGDERLAREEGRGEVMARAAAEVPIDTR
jgi:hypothetical protein